MHDDQGTDRHARDQRLRLDALLERDRRLTERLEGTMKKADAAIDAWETTRDALPGRGRL
ncbi:MAG: hypothetical protein GEU28_00360 [Dehalococcoidia bacterium]|nr:hypothetical protein [Dehalococcoidia bacterium]